MGGTIHSFRITLDLEGVIGSPSVVVVIGGSEAYLMYNCAFTIITITIHPV
jgi:hypothetical protein